MRTLLVTSLLVGLTFAATADEPKPAPIPATKIQPPKKDDEKPAPKPKAKAEPTLKVGDAAPALMATKWLQGKEVKSFEKGKVYVVEFWATWCGPCIVMMPHMAEMQQQLRDKGVTFIGFSSKDANNTQEKVAAFVEKRGEKLGYTFAYADDRDTNDAWMRAAGRNGIPCCFVVDQESKIAYIGHPMYLDLVLPRVVAGTWKGAAEMESMEKVEQDVTAVFKSFNGDPEAGLKGLADFEAKYPELHDIPYFRGAKLSMLIKSGKTEEAKKFAEGLIAKGLKQEDPIVLRTVAMGLGSAKDNKELLMLAVNAAEASVKISGEKDAQAVLGLANAYFAAGNKAKAQEYGKKALAAAENDSPALKKYIEGQVKKFDDQ